MAPRITVKLYDQVWSLKRTLLDRYGVRWQDPLNDPGSASVLIQNDDDDLADIAFGDILRFDLDGTARFAALVEDRGKTQIAKDGEVDEATEVSGRGTLAITEGAVIEAVNGSFQDTRLFNFASPGLDTTGWTAPVEIEQGPGEADDPRWQGAPANFPDSVAWWIWSEAPSPVNSPAGDNYFRKEVTVVTEGVYRFYAAADDGFELWVNGVRIGKDADLYAFYNWRSTKQADIYLTPGPHLLAIHAVNIDLPDLNPAGVIMSAYLLDGAGNPTTLLVSTDSSWLCLGYPAQPPGFTVGAIVRILVEEAQDRGWLPGLTLTFSDSADSAAVPWIVTSDVSFSVGSNLLGALLQLAETYCDVAMSPSSHALSMWITRGQVQPVTLGDTDLTELKHQVSS